MNNIKSKSNVADALKKFFTFGDSVGDGVDFMSHDYLRLCMCSVYVFVPDSFMDVETCRIE